ncbi:bifunctional helix-turn-helix transcriptional regulator/GNAT family N-acetyltransferase [Agaribacter flavus]|uniref:GNAT family N-acetyltransferase n=1 Tax=Agaribacter flavus TaxID=1902781 RepID=A0ABV7FP53_9ALTE
MDYFDEFGELGLGSRLKRLSDRLMTDANAVYQAFDLPIQPKWFSLLSLLRDKKRVSVVQASELLGLSQPALSQFCKQLLEVQLIELVPETKDARKKIMQLSSKGFVALENVQMVWGAVEKAAVDLSREEGNDFYQAVRSFENSLKNKSLLTRTKSYLSSIDSEALHFLPFEQDLAPYFEVINIEWVEQMFELEEIDKKVLSQPYDYIVRPGGEIWFAKHALHGIVGTCALLKTAEGEFELTKMGVLSAMRGHRIGERLLQHVIAQAEQMKVNKLYLLTNKKCEAAIHLYEKLGFEHSQDIMRQYGGHYKRCDVAMLYTG